MKSEDEKVEEKEEENEKERTERREEDELEPLTCKKTLNWIGHPQYFPTTILVKRKSWNFLNIFDNFNLFYSFDWQGMQRFKPRQLSTLGRE